MWVNLVQLVSVGGLRSFNSVTKTDSKRGQEQKQCKAAFPGTPGQGLFTLCLETWIISTQT